MAACKFASLQACKPASLVLLPSAVSLLWEGGRMWRLMALEKWRLQEFSDDAFYKA